MRITFSCLALVVLLPVFLGFAHRAQADITTGLVGYYTFEEGTGSTTSDVSGGGNSGSLTTGATWTSGKLGTGALLFPGSLSSKVTTSLTVSSYPISACAWIYPTDTGTENIFVNSSQFEFYFTGFGANYLSLSNHNNAINGGNLTLNAWNHACATVAADNSALLYLNGSQSASGNIQTLITSNAFSIGDGMNGKIDEVRIYDRVLSPTDIAQVYAYSGPPPVISNVASSTTGTSATITWTTDKVSTSTVSYGPTSSYGTASTSAASVTSHSIVLTGLSSSTTYHFQVASGDASGGYSTSTDYTFTTTFVDSTAPAISSISSNAPSVSSTTISWITDESSTSQVEYGTSTSYTASTTLDSTLATSHSALLSGLLSGTTYHYRVISTDASDNIASSTDQTLTTASFPGSDIISSSHLVDWRPGVTVGVTGGIPSNRTNLINVTSSPYLAGRSSTTGSIATSSTSITVASAANFSVGDDVSVDGVGSIEVDSLTITSGATASTNVDLALRDGTVVSVPVVSGDTAAQVATKVRSATYPGWTTGGSGTTVTFTANTYGAGSAVYFNPQSSGVLPAAGFTTVVQTGTDSLLTTIDSIAGTTITLHDAPDTGSSSAVLVHDDTSAIQDAINAAGANDIVYLPAGTYRVTSMIATGATKSNFTIKGDGESTLIDFRGHGQSLFQFGSDSDYIWWEGKNSQYSHPSGGISITGGLTKGSTRLYVSSTSGLSEGQIVLIAQDNDPDLPVVEVYDNKPQTQTQTAVISAVGSGWIEIRNGLYWSLDLNLNPKLFYAATWASGIGFEDMKVDATHSTAPWLIFFTQCRDCWMENVRLYNAHDYHAYLLNTVNMELRHDYFDTLNHIGSNGANLLVERSSAALVEDNIFYKGMPLVEVNFGSSGNVFGYNFFLYNLFNANQMAAAIVDNHGPHNSYNLYEGNIASSFQSDGYFGSASELTVFRNWFHGTCCDANVTATQNAKTIDLNRFTRNVSIVGNVLGSAGNTFTVDANTENPTVFSTRYIYRFGYPYRDSGGYTGTAQPSLGDYWADYGTNVGASGFGELDLDVRATTLLKGNYNTQDAGIPASESLGATTLPDSLYRQSKPSWFGPLAWPPFDPSDPRMSYEAIPAGYRYVNGNDPGTATSPSSSSFSRRNRESRDATVFGTGAGGVAISNSAPLVSAVTTVSASSVQMATTSSASISLPLSLSSFVNLLISLGVIPEEKVSAARSILSAPLVPSFSRDLKKGNTGDDVRSLQNILKSAGYLKATPNGVFGPATFTALKVYQKARGIPATGYFGPLTRASLSH